MESGEKNPKPNALIVGETYRAGSRLGESMSLSSTPESPWLLVGAKQGNGTGLDNGSAYLIDLSKINLE